jgi:DNA-binding transcriptional regulator YiaG
MQGEQIKALRLKLGLTQEEFAHRLGVTLCTVNRWENKKSIPSRLAVRQLEMIGESEITP